jgi:hypothetical protein
MADVVQEIETRSGHTARVAIGCARRGEIKHIRVVQWDDDEALYDGFRFALFTAREACQPGLLPNSSDQHPDHWDRVQYLVGEVRAVAADEDELKKDDKPDTKVADQHAPAALFRADGPRPRRPEQGQALQALPDDRGEDWHLTD